MGCVQSNEKPLTKNDTTSKIVIKLKPVFSDIVADKTTWNKRYELSEETKHIVKTTWTIIKQDIARVGVVTFVSLFEKYPDVQQLFVHFRGLSFEELQHNTKLRDHGLRVLNTIDKCISRLEEPERLHKLLVELAEKHIMYSIKTEYLALLVPQLLNALMPVLGDAWTDEVDSAWSAFLKHITEIMAEGIRHHMNNQSN
ncbi:hypothetical protein ACF0H5_002388 [Mactra antiquata]